MHTGHRHRTGMLQLLLANRGISVDLSSLSTLSVDEWTRWWWLNPSFGTAIPTTGIKRSEARNVIDGSLPPQQMSMML